jgi:radical SAM protein with 4Fe4S-binding SPASM domain
MHPPARTNVRQTVAGRAIAKLAPRMVRHPRFARRFVSVQTSRWWRAHRPVADGAAGPIRQLSLRVTDACNLRCRSCAQWGSHGHQLTDHASDPELPAHRYVALLDDLVCHGHHPSVYLWGGEPMLYEGVCDVIDAAAGRHLPVSIATNGHNTSTRAERLVRAPLFLLQMSIDGHCADLHDNLRPSVSGHSNYEEVCAALNAVHDARRSRHSDLPIIAALVTITEDNRAHLVDIYNVFRARVDLFVFYLGWWIGEDEAAAHEREFARRFNREPRYHRGFLGVERPRDIAGLAAQFAQLQRHSKDWSAPPFIVIPALTSARDLERYYHDHTCCFGYEQCVAIHQAAEIGSNGDVSPCRDYHDYVVGNVRDATISELWNGERFRTFRRSIARDGLMPVCSRCCGLMGY